MSDTLDKTLIRIADSLTRAIPWVASGGDSALNIEIRLRYEDRRLLARLVEAAQEHILIEKAHLKIEQNIQTQQRNTTTGMITGNHQIQTPDGPVLAKDIKPGDQVCTPEGVAKVLNTITGSVKKQLQLLLRFTENKQED